KSFLCLLIAKAQLAPVNIFLFHYENFPSKYEINLTENFISSCYKFWSYYNTSFFNFPRNYKKKCKKIALFLLFHDFAQKSGFFLFISPHFFTFSYRNILQRKSVKKNENYIEASY
uniref:hypothetical protein n=1 Tax=Anaerobutyricum hallii TaxID=39488 RepID=UPI003FF143C6